jgi:sugar phosphate isomerase/epimerase
VRFINLPLRYIEEQPRYLDLFLTRGLHPELGLDAWALDSLPSAWHERTAAAFHQAGLICAVHLPFFDLHPGSLDRLIHRVTQDRLLQAVDVAAAYRPAHFIAHLGYARLTYANFPELWLERSVATWNAILARVGAVPLFLENVFEETPTHHVAVLDALGGRAKACLDLGHWHSFALGHKRRNLHDWLNVLGDRLGHLHLHDNDGSTDQHLGLGQGSIPWDELWDFLRRRTTPVSMTCEPHTEADFLATEAYLAAHQGHLPI